MDLHEGVGASLTAHRQLTGVQLTTTWSKCGAQSLGGGTLYAMAYLGGGTLYATRCHC